MALRKFLFMNGSEGFAQEQGSLDELSLGKLTLAGVDGVAVDAGLAKIVNLGAPVLATDAARKSEVDAAIAAGTAAITAEAAARQAADTTLQGNIDAEASARQAADTSLTNALASETAARQAADSAEASARQAADSAEAAAREAADTTLQNNINAEAATRAAADTSLTNALASEAAARQAADSAEASARQSADTTLQGNIDAEAATRAAADTSLQNAITAEAAARAAADTSEANARIAADATLQGNIDAEAAARAAADTSLTNALASETAARQAADAALQSALTAEVSARTSADTTLQSNIDAEASARQAADAALQSALTAEISARVSGDAATLIAANAYTDSVAAGFYVKAPVKALASGNITLSGEQTVDGVSLVAGDRVLVAGQGTSAENGIYVVAAGAWARSPDANVSAEVKDGMSVWVEQGTVYVDSTWVLVTNNPIVLDTTPLEFRQFSGLGQIVAGAGLDKTGNTLSVNVSSGIEILNDAVAVKLAANPGLMFSGDALDAKVDGNRAMAKDASGLFVKHDGNFGLSIDAAEGLRVDLASGKGLEFSGGDIAIKLESDAGMEFDGVNGGLELKLVSADRLTKSASGLDVVGVPSQFKVNGVAVSAYTSAMALSALTASGTENANAGNAVSGTADSYHSHATVQFPMTVPAETADVYSGNFVYSTGNDTVGPASCSTAATSRVIGLASLVSYNGATGVGTAKVIASGLVPMSGLVAGTAYYLGSAGTAVEFSALQSGQRVIRVGYAVSASKMVLSIQDMGQKA